MLLLACLVTVNIMVGVLTSVGQTSFAEAIKRAALAETRTLGVMLLLMPVFLRDTLKMSNRFAGPMYRLRMAFKQMAAGELPGPIKFRDGDFWQEAAEDFNVVREQCESLRDENESLKAEIQALRDEQVAV